MVTTDPIQAIVDLAQAQEEMHLLVKKMNRI